MTSYHISIGYNRGDIGRDEAWERLKAIVSDLREHPERVAEEARRFGAPETCGEGCRLDDYIRGYGTGSDDLALKIIERPTANKIDDDCREIVQYASTGCALKYHMRRAACRLILNAAHREGIEVNLHVA